LKQKVVIKYEYQKLKVGEHNFTKNHFDAFVKLNNLHGNKYFTVLHNGIQFKEYVGIIQVGGFSVEIHPKSDKHQLDSQWRNVLIQMLHACGKISPKTTGAANVNKHNLNLLEIYFELFLKEIELLIRLGLIKKYRKESKNINALKGKLEFSGHIKRNLIHKERFYTTHQVYDENNKIHQILSLALEIIENLNSTPYINSFVSKIRFSYPEVSKIRVTAKTFGDLILDRKTKPYDPALKLARLIVLNYSPDISSGKEQMLSLLFNMNDLWEKYVLIKLKNHFKTTDSNWKVKGQDVKKFIKNHYLKPDIILKNKLTNEVIVIDTKWKLGDKYISVQDLRQVYTYGRYWEAKKVMLLYPGENRETSFEKYLNEFDNTQHFCKLGFVSVLDGSGGLCKAIGNDIEKLLDI